MVKDDVTAQWYMAVPKNVAMFYEWVLLGESRDTFISGLTPSEFQANKLI
jgi:hypothetical protein